MLACQSPPSGHATGRGLFVVARGALLSSLVENLRGSTYAQVDVVCCRRALLSWKLGGLAGVLGQKLGSAACSRHGEHPGFIRGLVLCFGRPAGGWPRGCLRNGAIAFGRRQQAGLRKERANGKERAARCAAGI